jgi:hypothetical protein
MHGGQLIFRLGLEDNLQQSKIVVAKGQSIPWDYFLDYWFTDDAILLVRLFRRTPSILVFPAAIGAWWIVSMILLALAVPGSYSLWGFSSLIALVVGIPPIGYFFSVVASKKREAFAKRPIGEVSGSKTTKRLEWSQIERANLTGKRLSMSTTHGTIHVRIDKKERDAAVALMTSKLGKRLTLGS